MLGTVTFGTRDGRVVRFPARHSRSFEKCANCLGLCSVVVAYDRIFGEVWANCPECGGTGVAK